MSEHSVPEGFVPCIPSIELKGLGFNEPCIAKFVRKQFSMNVAGEWYRHNSNEITTGWISAPLYQQVFKWFRKEHYIHCEISETTDCEEDNESWNFIVYKYKFGDNDAMKRSITDYKTYEEAELACLNKLIEIVKQK
jgi:hypothetical protein